MMEPMQNAGTSENDMQALIVDQLMITQDKNNNRVESVEWFYIQSKQINSVDCSKLAFFFYTQNINLS